MPAIDTAPPAGQIEDNVNFDAQTSLALQQQATLTTSTFCLMLFMSDIIAAQSVYSS